jgi:hypothetical protein
MLWLSQHIYIYDNNLKILFFGGKLNKILTHPIFSMV